MDKKDIDISAMWEQLIETIRRGFDDIKKAVDELYERNYKQR